MVGIVLASHGNFGAGILEAANMLFGGVEQTTCVSLQPGQSSENFLEALTTAAQEVDSGDGAIILCDILGGTPSNRAALLLSKYTVIAGINLALLIELLGQRMDDSIDIATLVEVGRQGVVHINPLFGM